MEARPARRHIKNCSVEAKYVNTRKLILRLLSDACATKTALSGPIFGTATPQRYKNEGSSSSAMFRTYISVLDVFRRGFLLSNVLYGSKKL